MLELLLYFSSFPLMMSCYIFQLMLNDPDLQKAAGEMLNDAHDEVQCKL